MEDQRDDLYRVQQKEKNFFAASKIRKMPKKTRQRILLPVGKTVTFRHEGGAIATYRVSYQNVAQLRLTLELVSIESET